MTYFVVKPSLLRGTISIPPSKSQTLRAILFASFATGKSTIHNYLHSPDTFAMIEACRYLGAQINIFTDQLEVTGINGKISQIENVIDAGNSGIILRFFTALGALTSLPMVITGDYSVRHHRPMKALMDALSNVGVHIVSMRNDDFAPIIVKGPLKSGKISVDGQDSQPVSALLIASAFANIPVELVVKNPGELPWVAMTLEWFDRLGIFYNHQDYQLYKLDGGSHYSGFEYVVPADLSSAAFPIAAALVTQSCVTIENIEIDHSQGDKELISVFKEMGAEIEYDGRRKLIKIDGRKKLKGISVDINRFIDSLTILAVVGCFSEGEMRIKNAEIARKKECNRIECIASELKKMGAKIEVTPDGLIVHESSLKGTQVESYGDHRMVLSLSVAALGAQGFTTIRCTDCIKKTFPDFAKDFKKIGADIEEIKDEING